MIQSIILGFLYLDIFMTDMWLTGYFISEEDNENDEPLNPFFDQSGFESKFIVKNLGSTFIYLVMLVATLFIFGIVKAIGVFWIR